MLQTKINAIIFAMLLILNTNNFYGQDSPFLVIECDEQTFTKTMGLHTNLLGLETLYPAPERVFWALRMSRITTPGDYFFYPRGADTTVLSSEEILEFKSTLDGLISDKYYDSYVLDNVGGFKYELRGGIVSRREYFVKYARADTVYVISGLLGKFLSFYRTIPGKEVISIDQLKRESKKLSPSIEFKKDLDFVKKDDDRIYFVEYLDREQKLRVRNYQVVEYWQETDKERDDSIGKYYNLIEITRFLDEEAMP